MMEEKDGKPILNLAHLRAGHYPGVKNPPWGINEGLLSLSLRKHLNKESALQAFVPTGSSEFIPVVIRHSKHPSHDELNLLAFPVHREDEEKWTISDEEDD